MALRAVLSADRLQYNSYYVGVVGGITEGYGRCDVCFGMHRELRTHFIVSHAAWRALWFCPVDRCLSVLPDQERWVRHLYRDNGASRGVVTVILDDPPIWPMLCAQFRMYYITHQRLAVWFALYSAAGVAMDRREFDFMEKDVCATVVTYCLDTFRGRVNESRLEAITSHSLSSPKRHVHFSDDVSPVGSIPVRVHDVTELPSSVVRPRGGFGVPQLDLELALVSVPVSESVVTFLRVYLLSRRSPSVTSRV